MKKTIIALMALAGVAMADTLTLTTYDVKYGTSSTLSTGNQLMSWDDTQTYTNWYMEFSFTALVDQQTTIGTRWVSTICSAPGTGRDGIAASVKMVTAENDVDRIATISLSNGDEYNSLSSSITFSTADVLTMAVYDGYAYIGNQSTKEYVSLDLSTVTLAAPSTMTSGGARAFANANSTKIGETTIASLDNLVIPDGQKLDIVKLVTTGAAVTIPEPATATLSLLARAGLAARRRRK